MTADQWQNVRDLFERALDAEPPDVRAWLDAQSATPSVRAEVASLLAHHSRAGNFLAEPIASRVPDLLDMPDEETPSFGAGTQVGHYTIVRELGRGAMGRVYLATDTRLGRTVALKALAPGLTSNPSHRERLKREAQAAAALSHPGICTVYALEEIDDRLFIASEAIDGETLRVEMSSPQRPDAARVAATARELADALASAHRHGITHRDLKPENVMRDRSGRLKILDFGLARRDAPGPAPQEKMLVTLPGALVGTPAYMAPEQLNGQPADQRTDVFAYGVLMYEYACGVHPFDAATSLARVARVLESQARPVTERAPQVSPAVAAVIDRCLQKTPAARFASAIEIAAVLDEPAAAPAGRRSLTWWRVHQSVLMAIYILAGTIGWSIKETFPGAPALWLFIALGVGGAVAGIPRGHLVFTEWINPRSLSRERRRVRQLITIGDVMVAAALTIDGLWMATVRPLYAVLTIAFAIGIALAGLVMEPATTAAVFGHESD
jgi:serine/threonine-protein kinase